MQKLLSLLIELENKIPAYKTSNTKVSKGDVGWHIQHTALATVRIIDALKQSNPSAYKWKFNWTRSYVLLINNIPKGRKAPQSVTPTGDITEETLYFGIEKAKGRIQELETLHVNHHFMHPFFGNLNRKATIKFLKLHARHHLKIINHIIN
jgi:hypothetical protein